MKSNIASLSILLLLILSSCTDTFDCNCFDYKGKAKIITERKTVSRIAGEDTIITLSQDTFEFELLLGCDKFHVGSEEGEFMVTDSLIIFNQTKDYCPPNVDCIYTFGRNVYKWECSDNGTRLILTEEFKPERTLVHQLGSVTYSLLNQEINY
ncbi:MAG: hypothetical protein P1U56_04710 [Saprospiraceae bacterium]|nr:hypothetical protein [Saprospiraceae bacterium]